MESSPSFRSLCVSSRVSPVSTSRLPPSPTCLSPRSPHAQSPSASIFCYSSSLDYCSTEQSLGSSSFCGKQFSRSTCNTNPKPDSKEKLGFKDVEAFYSAEQPGPDSPSEFPPTEPESPFPSPPPSASVSRSLTYYEVLGVPQSASAKEIRAAYRQKALSCHPDVAPSGEQQRFNDLFAEINEAYAILTEPHSRSLYDAKLASRGIRARPVTIPAGFNSYSYQFKGFKPDIWAAGNSQVNGAGSRAYAGVAPVDQDSGATAYSGSATSSVDTRNISSSWRGRNWETDQCWC